MVPSPGASLYEYSAWAPQITHTACTLVIESAIAISAGIGPKGLPLKSISKPATITRTPLLASFVQTLGSSSSKNWASSIPTTCTSLPSNKIDEELSTGVDCMELALCDTTAVSSKRVSVFGLNISTFKRAICARRSLRISSSVLPENIEPQITSILPPNSFLRLKTSSLNNMTNYL